MILTSAQLTSRRSETYDSLILLKPCASLRLQKKYRSFHRRMFEQPLGVQTLSARELWGSIPRTLPTTRNRYDVSLELVCPVAKPQRWAPPPATSYRRYNEDLEVSTEQLRPRPTKEKWARKVSH